MQGLTPNCLLVSHAIPIELLTILIRWPMPYLLQKGSLMPTVALLK